MVYGQTPYCTRNGDSHGEVTGTNFEIGGLVKLPLGSEAASFEGGKYESYYS